MGRIFGDDGRCVILPLDHGTVLGRVEGLEDPHAALRRFLGAPCDGFLLGPGVLRRTAPLFAHRRAPARLLTADLYWQDDRGAGHDLGATIESAAALGVDGVKFLMPWDVPAGERARTAALIGRAIAAADPYGLPVMVEPVAQATEPGPEAVAVTAHGCRVAAELGADIIKLAHPGDPDVLAAWAEESQVPLVLLGGPASGGPEELVTMVDEAVRAGASGIVIGRKVWQRPLDEAVQLLGRLADVVHGGDRPQRPAARPISS